MKRKYDKTDVGVVIGRFQVHEPHEAHKQLIQGVLDEHESVVILLGLAPVKGTKNNPLDYPARKLMLQNHFPDATILYVRDHRSDEQWSKDVDAIIDDVLNPGQSATLYGSRDSFINYYTGRFQTAELEPECFISGTEIREKIRNTIPKNADWRAGAIWQAHNQFDKCEPTVDIAIVDLKEGKLLLGQKSHETKWRFPGGFADPRNETYEEDAIREAKEETDLVVQKLDYISSRRIDDFRYRKEANKVKTIFYFAEYEGGRPIPGDDLSKVKWFDFSDLAEELPEDNFVSGHIPLYEDLTKFLKRKDI